MFQKFVNIVKHFRYFQIELFLFIFVFSLAVEDVTVTLIAQDKLCLKLLNSTKICSNLSKLKADDDVNGILIHHKDEILVQVTTFSFYQSVIYTVPVIISSMFLSSWADRHKSSTKTLLCLTAFMAGLESIYILICAIYFDSSNIHNHHCFNSNIFNLIILLLLLLLLWIRRQPYVGSIHLLSIGWWITIFRNGSNQLY